MLFWWRPFGQGPLEAYFDVVVRSEQPGTAELRYNVDGAGQRSADPVKVHGHAVTHVRFKISVAKLDGLNFTPRTEAGDVDVLSCWITSQSGEVIAVMPLDLIAQTNAQSSALLSDGALRFHSRPQEEKNALRFRPNPPIELAVEPPPAVWKLTLVFALSFGAVLAFSLVLGDRVAAARWISRAAVWVKAHPKWALLGAAAVSVTLSCHPVIFCGKSFVSPDNGLVLLYEANPTVPGGTGERIDNAVGSDIGATMYWFMPVSMVQHRAIFHDHEFPLWNRFNWSGVMLVGQGISMIGDPFQWPAIIAGGAPWAWDLKFVVVQWLFAFGVGLIVWRTSGSLPAALLLALSAPFMGFFAYRYNHPAFFSLCYSPWILLAWIQAARVPQLRQVIAWSFFLIFANWCELYSGTAKEMSALLLLLNLAGALMLVFAAQPWRWRLQRLAIFAWAGVVFLLLSAPMWMTFLDGLGKAFTAYGQSHAYQIAPDLGIGLFDDLFYRQFMPQEFLFNPSTNFFVLIGVMWALVRARALAGERVLWAVLPSALLAAALVFGVISPATVAAVPFLKSIYHVDNTFSCVLFILFFVVAGFGLRECLARMRGAEWQGDWALMLTFVALLVAAYFGFSQAAHKTGKVFLNAGETIPKSPFFMDYASALLAALVILPAAWREAHLRRPAAAAWALVAICAFVTLHFRHGMYLQTKFDFYTRNPKGRADLRHLTSPALETVRAASTEPARVLGLDGIMVPGFSTDLGFETISGPDPLLNPAMLRVVDTLGLKRVADWRIEVKTKHFAAAHRALDMLNVRYLLAPPSHASEAPPLPGTKQLAAADLTVFESETAWPRAFFTDTVAPYNGAEEFRRLVEEGDGRPFAAQPPSLRAKIPLPARNLAQRVVQPARNYRLTSNTTSFEIDAPSAGVAVLMEGNDSDDILAYVDDEPTLCLPINHAFRGAFIAKPGHHVVKFEYWPEAFVRALSLGAIGLGALAITFLWWWRLGRPAAKSSALVAAPAESALVS